MARTLIFSVTIPGIPVPTPRPRVAFQGGRAHAYISGRALAYRHHIIASLRLAGAPRGIANTVAVEVAFALPRPKRLGAGPAQWHRSRPDVDNLSKSVLDALVDAGVLSDDAVVAELVARKLHAGSSVEPHTTIAVYSLDV